MKKLRLQSSSQEDDDEPTAEEAQEEKKKLTEELSAERDKVRNAERRVTELERGLIIRAVDVAAINEGCDTIDLLPWLPAFWAEDV